MRARIRLLKDLPIARTLGCVVGNEYDAEIPDGLRRGKMASFYVDGQLIKACRHEYEIATILDADVPATEEP